jgi:hypothetical protein
MSAVAAVRPDMAFEVVLIYSCLNATRGSTHDQERSAIHNAAVPAGAFVSPLATP